LSGKEIEVLEIVISVSGEVEFTLIFAIRWCVFVDKGTYIFEKMEFLLYIFEEVKFAFSNGLDIYSRLVLGEFVL